MTCARRETILPVGTLPQLGFPGEMLMVAPAGEGIDLFKLRAVPFQDGFRASKQNWHRYQTAVL